MPRRSRRKNRFLDAILLIILLLLIGFLGYRIYKEKFEPKNTKENEVIETKKNSDKKESTKEEKKDEEVKKEETGPAPTEEEETKKERDKNITISMELIGEDEITINKGDKYTDPGITATDSEGNDLTSEVEITNNVDTSKAGKYSVVYSYGKNIIIRRVIVK